MDRGPLHLDKETRSASNLPKVGAHRYAEDPTTSIILARYRFGRETNAGWRGTLPPPEVIEHVRQGGMVKGHNAAFERAMWNNHIAPLTGVYLTIEQQDCTMARAAAMGLPGSLDTLGKALELTFQKDKAGYALMMKMCKPRGVDADGNIVWWEDEKDIVRLDIYCDGDIASECDADDHLPPLSATERRVWELDQKINDRGFMIDVPLVRRAAEAVAEAKRRADDAMWRVTNGAVKKATQTKALADWLTSRGIACTSVADNGLDDLIIGTQILDDAAAEQAIRIRRASAGAFKFETMLAAVCRDGRVRGSLAYHAALSGRWAGRVTQPQNFKRMDTDEDVANVAEVIKLLIDFDRRGSNDVLDAIDMLIGPPLELLTMCARPMIIAAPGKKLVSGDFTNIEGRLNAWFAGEHWKLDAFRAYDRGDGPDMYRVTAASVLQKSIDSITREERQISGKVPELACGYQGGLLAFQKMAAKNSVVVADSHARRIVADWRETNPAIVQSWADLQAAAIEAVSNPGVQISVLGDKVRYLKPAGQDFLFCRLPSGRVISYANPTVSWKTKIVTIDDEQVELNRFGVSYWGTKNGRWLKLDLYGGAQCAHVVSGTARDLLVAKMFAVEAAGYPIILTIHDEILAEVDEGFGSATEFEMLMSLPEDYLPGLPLATKAWEAPRYEK